MCVRRWVHADESDVKKLLSLQYVVIQTRPLAKSEHNFTQIFGPILNRIDEIIERIILKNNSLHEIIKSIKEDIDINENLTPYWRYKLEILIDFGIINNSYENTII